MIPCTPPNQPPASPLYSAVQMVNAITDFNQDVAADLRRQAEVSRTIGRIAVQETTQRF